ncbi:hypothetical protein PSAB6_430078 [Paraburkholderia sabiae]|nr:hypothetical protein PSAB6_430078 [Paraburkholderia sabiae]
MSSFKSLDHTGFCHNMDFSIAERVTYPANDCVVCFSTEIPLKRRFVRAQSFVRGKSD